MIVLILLLVLSIAIFGFRLSRLIGYYKESISSDDADERKIAHKNFIIHLVFCTLFLLIIGMLIYNLILASGAV